MLLLLRQANEDCVNQRAKNTPRRRLLCFCGTFARPGSGVVFKGFVANRRSFTFGRAFVFFPPRVLGGMWTQVAREILRGNQELTDYVHFSKQLFEPWLGSDTPVMRTPTLQLPPSRTCCAVVASDIPLVSSHKELLRRMLPKVEIYREDAKEDGSSITGKPQENRSLRVWAKGPAHMAPPKKHETRRCCRIIQKCTFTG